MKKMINKILSFLGIKKDNKTAETKEAVSELVDLLCRSRETTETTAVFVAAEGNYGGLEEKYRNLLEEEKNRLTTDFLQKRTEDINDLTQRMEVLETESTPIAGEVKDEILVFDKNKKAFKKVPSEIQKKVLDRVNSKNDIIVSVFQKTKDSSIDGLELVPQETKKVLVEKEPEAVKPVKKKTRRSHPKKKPKPPVAGKE